MWLLWQSYWDSLHLNTIKLVLRQWASSNRPTRREKVVLTRLRMGCTLPNHMLPFISHSVPPQGSRCNVILAIHHILVHCMRYRQARRSLKASLLCGALFPVTQATLLGDDPDVIDCRIIFLTETKSIRELWLTYILVFYCVWMHHIYFCYCTYSVDNMLVWIIVWSLL